MVDPIAPRPSVVVALALLAILTSTMQLTLALRAARQQSAQQVARLIQLCEARDEAVADARDRSDLLATLSHEIRTPLQAVVGVSDLLLTSELDARQRHQVGLLRQGGASILRLVDDVLDQATIDTDQLTLTVRSFGLAELLDEVVGLLGVTADAKHVRLEVKLNPACPPWVRGDGTRLRQVLTNLLANAIKFTDLGVVTLTVGPSGRRNQPGALRFEVTDTGAGIPASELGRIFLPYRQVLDPARRSSGGNGLGLAISQSLVKAMGAEIKVSSREGVGSTFSFEVVLPVEPTSDAATGTPENRRLPGPGEVETTRATTAEGRPVALAGTGSQLALDQVAGGSETGQLRILLAEDDLVGRQTCQLLLQQLGHLVDVVCDGAAAVAATRSATYDLVLMDSRMPGLDGVDAVRIIRDDEAPGEHVPVIALTGALSAADRCAYAAAGMDGLLVKPVGRAVLTDALCGIPTRIVGAAQGCPTTSRSRTQLSQA